MDITPYLTFNGDCEEALNFYAECLGGEIKALNRFEGSPVEDISADKQKVLHAVFVAKGVTLMASDSAKEMEGKGNGNVQLSLNFDTAEEIERVYHALSQGAKITMELQDTFWGARFGMLTDKFGIPWMFNYDKPQHAE